MAKDLAGPPPREAIDYLASKGTRTGFSYRDVWREEHAHAFTVAKAMELDLLSDIRDSLTTALEEGKPFEQWRREMTEYLSKRGWWGRKTVTDPRTGEQVVAQLGSSRRLETIWRVNMGQAYQAGVWERGQRSTSHPYLLYRIGPSREHRLQHVAWDGVVLPKDDPFWSVANPRNGWGCKCSTRFVSRAQYRRYERSGIPGVRRMKTDRPELREKVYRNKRTGESHVGYDGIDPGFEHNPGAGRMQQVQEVFRQKDARSRTVSPVGPAVADSLRLPEGGDRELRRAAQRALDAVSSVHGARLRGTRRPLPTVDVAETGAARGSLRRRRSWPTAITLGRSSWRPEMMTAHEIGHFVDLAALPGEDYASRVEPTPEVARVMRRIEDSAAYRAVQRLGQGAMGDPEELFARAYAQWIAWRSGSTQMRQQVDRALASRVPARRLLQWGYGDFLPIAEAMDELFEAMGWLKRG